jgi:hypothetical protein
VPDDRQQRFDFEGGSGKKPPRQTYEPQPRPPPTWWQRPISSAKALGCKVWAVVWLLLKYGSEIQAAVWYVSLGVTALSALGFTIWASKPTPPPAKNPWEAKVERSR